MHELSITGQLVILVIQLVMKHTAVMVIQELHVHNVNIHFI